MFINMLIAITATLTLLIAWLLVQHFSRIFSKRHPEFGPVREEGRGCGSSCGCHGKKSCKNK